MMRSSRPGRPTRRRALRRLLLLTIVLAVIVVGGIFWVRHVYDTDLQAVGTSQQTQLVTIKSGSTVQQIAKQLQDAKLIRSAWAFQLYVHSKDLSDSLEAGTYSFSPSQDTPTIIKTMTQGTVTTKLITILPGRRIDQVKSDLINDGFSPDAVTAALDPAQYADLPVMAYRPSGANLEGLLYPDSFQKAADTDPSVIIRESLTEMGDKLTSDVQAAFAAEGLTTYQGLILTSIVDQEVSKPTDQAQAAQVFLTRLKSGMMLGSDVTAYYGAIEAGQPASTTYDSAYNTLLHTGLPPTPISTISASSLQAASHPASTDWLYFVAGDNGTTYFSKTLAEHQALTQQYCHKLCGE